MLIFEILTKLVDDLGWLRYICARRLSENESRVKVNQIILSDLLPGLGYLLR